jgi:SNF2 family DNA or RNA helicase
MELDADQKRMVEFCLEHKQTYIAQVMGFGKTAVAIEVIRRTGQKAMVFCPIKVGWHVWPKELTLWAPELSFAIAHGPNKLGALESGADVIIINYEGIDWLSQQKMPNWQKRMLILDEASKMKSHATVRFEKMEQAHGLWTDYRIALSGTPAAAGLVGLWSQYYLLDRGERLGKNISAFRSKYCEAISRPGIPVTIYKVWPHKEKEVHEAVADITASVDMTGRDTRPPLKHNKIYLEMPKPLRKMYDALEKDFILQLKEGTVTIKNIMTKSGKLRQLVQGALYIPGVGYTGKGVDKRRKTEFIHTIKADALKELVNLLQGQPALVAVNFLFDPIIIRRVFKYDVPMFSRELSQEDSSRLLARWDSKQLPLLMLHPKTAAHGLNMQEGGSNLVWYTQTWSLEEHEQLGARLRRRGQKAEYVTNHHLIMKDSVDESIVDALNSHARTQDDLIKFLTSRYC